MAILSNHLSFSSKSWATSAVCRAFSSTVLIRRRQETSRATCQREGGVISNVDGEMECIISIMRAESINIVSSLSLSFTTQNTGL